MANNTQQQQLRKNDSKFDILQQRIRDCTGELGLMDPKMVMNMLNKAAREEDPEAYEPEIVLQHRKRQD